MKRVLFALLMLTGMMAAQTTTYTGTVRDLSGVLTGVPGAPVTSGSVTFTQMPSVDTTISGVSRFVPVVVTCGLDGTGAVKAADLVSPCSVVQNTALTPSGTSYKVCIQPFFTTPGSCFVDYATVTTKDISTVVPTPQLSPTYSYNAGAQTFTAINNKLFVTSSTAGADLGAQIQSCLTSLGNTRGICDATAMTPVWPATVNMSGFTCKPGETVILGNGTYVVTSTIIVQGGCNFIGNFGHSNGEGTVLKAANGLNADVMQLQGVNYPTLDWMHWTRIQGIHIDGNKANNATGNGISVLSPMGEASSIRDVYITGCAVDGLYVTGLSQASGYYERISSFLNGRYGFNFDDVAGVNTAIGLSGDDNGTALWHIKGEQGLAFTIIGTKMEEKIAAVQQDGFLLEGLNGIPTITIRGGSDNPSVSGTQANFVHIINGAVNLKLEDFWISQNVPNIIKDDVRSITVPVTLYNAFSAAGHITSILHSAVPTFYTGGANPAILLGNNQRFALLNGSGASKDTIWMDTSNVTHFKSPGGGGFSFDSTGTAGVLTLTDASGVFNMKNGLTAGVLGSTIADTRDIVQSSHYCGNAGGACSNTANLQMRRYVGIAPLTAGAATVTGINAPTGIVCTCNDFTALNACRVTAAAPGASITLTFAGVATDSLAYSCDVW